MLAQRQRSVAFARRREERVRDRRNERDGADLAGSTHSFGAAVDDVRFYRRRLVHMWNLELVEVRRPMCWVPPVDARSILAIHLCEGQKSCAEAERQ